MTCAMAAGSKGILSLCNCKSWANGGAFVWDTGDGSLMTQKRSQVDHRWNTYSSNISSVDLQTGTPHFC